MLRAISKGRQVLVAERLSRRLGRRVHQSTVSHYASGAYTPRGPMMVAIQVEFGVPLSAWTEAPTGAAPSESTTSLSSPDDTGANRASGAAEAQRKATGS